MANKQIQLKDLVKFGAKKAPFPIEFKPELATLVKEVPDNPNWSYEIKFDGIRIISKVENGRVSLLTRNNKDWTRKLPQIVKAIEALQLDNAILDGELVALDQNGISRFQLIQNYLELGQDIPVYYYAFDIIYHNAYKLNNVPLIQRKAYLATLIPKNSLIRFSEHLEGEGLAILKQACTLKLEGIMAKRKDSFYLSKRSADWLKIKCNQRQEFVIAGFTEPKGSRQFFGSLLLGYYNDARQLIYCGRVGTGFNQTLLKLLHEKMRGLLQDKPAFYRLPSIPETRQAHWLKPTLVAEIEFTEWTNDGRIRHPSFKGLREDKSAKQVVIELPQSLAALNRKTK
jgi:bifunctional non-homologous end joining protein LigD